MVHDAVVVACRAPSLHNSQPWRWVADGAELHLFADRRRLVQVADRSGREQFLRTPANEQQVPLTPRRPVSEVLEFRS